MTTVAIQLKTACRGCGENVPINGVFDRVSCPVCDAPITFDANAWKMILEAPALDGARAEPGKAHVGQVETAYTVIRAYTRLPATCARCRGELPMPQSLEQVMRGWCVCVQCGEHVPVRRAPESIAGLGGIAHVIGEEAAADDVAARGTFDCAKCGASLPIDRTTSRASVCTYCNASVLVPDDVWGRLHPIAAQRTWFIHIDTATASLATGALFEWGAADDVVIGRDGNLYVIGSDTVTSCDASFKTRWIRKGLGLAGNHTERCKIAATADGHLLAWRQRKHIVVKLSCADGATVATLGGREPEGATAHALDVEFAGDLAADIDGTIVSVIHNRVLRWAADGTPIETWPPSRGLFGEKHQKLEPLFHTQDGDRNLNQPQHPPEVGELKNRPLALYSDQAKLTIAADGSMFFQRHDAIEKVAHDGKKVWSATLPHSTPLGRPAVDGRGNVYALRWLRAYTHGIVRLGADGRNATLLVDGGAPGTPICEEHNLVVFPDGTMFVLDFSGKARVFSPDGSALLASPNARSADATRARRIGVES